MSLRRLRQARNCPQVNIYFDSFGPDPRLKEVEFVIGAYFPHANLFQALPHIAAPSGCWNILKSIQSGFREGADNVFLVEEDVMVYPHFFDWHLAQDADASCGRLTAYNELPYGKGQYTNPGSCLRRRLLEALDPHINDDYFSRLGDYLNEHFEPADEWSKLDDGLIRRVLRKMGGKTVYPDKPVCAHQGFRGYNVFDIYKNPGNIEERIAGLEKLIASIKPGDRYAKDFEPF